MATGDGNAFHSDVTSLILAGLQVEQSHKGIAEKAKAEVDKIMAPLLAEVGDRIAGSIKQVYDHEITKWQNTFGEQFYGVGQVFETWRDRVAQAEKDASN